MMIIDLNYHVCWKKGTVMMRSKTQKIKEKDDKKGTPTPDLDAPIGQFQSRLWDARRRRKNGRMCGIPVHKNGKDHWRFVLSSYDRNGGSYKKMNGAGKGRSCTLRKLYFHFLTQ